MMIKEVKQAMNIAKKQTMCDHCSIFEKPNKEKICKGCEVKNLGVSKKGHTITINKNRT